jgi:hypothetical protein
MTPIARPRLPLAALLALTTGTTLAAAPPASQRPPFREVAPGASVDAGEVPPAVLARARELAAARAAADHVAAPVLEKIEAVTWPDGGLGCGRPGDLNTQRLVEGYRLIFSAGGRSYVFHASAAGQVIPCDRTLRLPHSPTRPKVPLEHPDPRDNPSE